MFEILRAKRVERQQSEHWLLLRLDAALEHLALSVLPIRKNVFNACAKTVAADGILQGPEAELLRAIADSLDCPIPPFIPSASA